MICSIYIGPTKKVPPKKGWALIWFGPLFTCKIRTLYAQEVGNIPWIWNDSEICFCLRLPSKGISPMLFTPRSDLFFSPVPDPPSKSHQRTESLFRFNFSNKFSKGLKPSSVKLGYFWKGMNINQDWYLRDFSPQFHQNIFAFWLPYFVVSLDITGRSISKSE